MQSETGMRTRLTCHRISKHTSTEPGSRHRQHAAESRGNPIIHMGHGIHGGGEGEIRTRGALLLNGFQDRLFRPLRHLSKPHGRVSRTRHDLHHKASADFWPMTGTHRTLEATDMMPEHFRVDCCVNLPSCSPPLLMGATRQLPPVEASERIMQLGTPLRCNGMMDAVNGMMDAINGRKETDTR